MVTVPEVEYLTTFGFVEINRENPRVTWLFSFFCSSIFAFISKNKSSAAEYSPVRSACKLLRLIETTTPETAYCGFTANSSLYFISANFIFNFCILLIHLATIDTDSFWVLWVIRTAVVCWNGKLSHKLECFISLNGCFWFQHYFFGNILFNVNYVVDCCP